MPTTKLLLARQPVPPDATRPSPPLPPEPGRNAIRRLVLPLTAAAVILGCPNPDPTPARGAPPATDTVPLPTPATIPLVVHPGTPADVRSPVAVGHSHTLAIRSDGSLWAWGLNDFGQLGDGTKKLRRRPVRVGTDTDWVSVGAGSRHSLAVKADGTLWAWGGNYGGQLGDGSTRTRLTKPGRRPSRPKRGLLGDGFNRARLTPAQVGTASDWVHAVGGAQHTLALKADGSLWAFGTNDYGELGDGTFEVRHHPTRVGRATWTRVAAFRYSSVGLKTDGTLWSWGDGGSSLNPALCNPPAVRDGASPDDVLAFEPWTLEDGLRQMKRPRRPSRPQGRDTKRPTPERIGTAADWSQIAAGSDRFLALDADGALWAWGDLTIAPDDGHLPCVEQGPVQIGRRRWAEVGISPFITVARAADGTLWAWDNADWETRYLRPRLHAPPNPLAAEHAWSRLFVGPWHAAAIEADGTLWTWGRNLRGNLGDGTTLDRPEPTQVLLEAR